MKNNKNVRAILLGVILMVLALGGATYAFFTATITDGDKGSSVIIRTGTLRIAYADTEYINVSGVLPGDSYSKVVTVTNEGNVPAYYHLVWMELLNELVTQSDLTMEISCTSNTDTCGGLSNTVVSDSGSNIPILYNVEIGMLETHTYTIIIHFNETGSNQNDNQGKTISGKIGIIEARDLAVNLYGYVYDENSSIMPNVVVELHSDPVSVLTDATGRYEFDSIPLGTHTAYIKTSDGTSTITTTSLSVTQGKSTSINNTNVTLTPTRQSIGINIETDPINPILSLTLPSGTLKEYYEYYDGSTWVIENYYNYKSSITSITFDNKINIPGDVVSTWDVSEDQNSTVMAYIKSDGVSGYDLHIQGKDGMYAPINSSRLFYYFTKVTTMNGLENLNTSKVTNMSQMFSYLSSLQQLNLTDFNTSKVTNVNEMFYQLGSLTSLDLSMLDVSKVTDFGNGQLFKYCSALKYLNISNWDFTGATSLTRLFYELGSLETIVMKNINTSTITTMQYMFYNLTSLKSIDLSDLDTENVTNMGYMFRQCTSLTTLDLSMFNTGKLTNARYLICYSNNITSLNLSNWIFSDLVKPSNILSDNSTGYNTVLTTVILDNVDTSSATSFYYWFDTCNSLTSLDVSDFDTSNITNMNSMFAHCNKLTSINLGNIDTSKVTDISYIFYDCSSLTSIDLSPLSIANLTNMNGMFSGCSALTSANLSSLNIANVTEMNGIFNNCSSLTSVNFGSLNTSNITNMGGMFSGCSSLTSLNLSTFNTSNVTIMGYMFSGCTSLTTLNLSSFNTSKVINITAMFQNCSALTSLDISNAAFTAEGIVYSYYDQWSEETREYTFEGITSGITIHVKDSTAQTFINARLSDVSKTGTVTVG